MTTTTTNEEGTALAPIPEPQAPVVHDAKVGVAARWRIALDVVTEATKELPDRQRDALRWLAQYGMSANISGQDLAGRLMKKSGEAYSYHSLYAALTGRRGEQGVGLDGLCSAIEDFRRRLNETNAKLSTGFIETPMTRAIFSACRTALRRRRVVMIHGPSQTGKTAAVAEYARLHNHGETILVRCPTAANLTAIQSELADRFGVPRNQRADELSRRIMSCFDERTLLILDEAHQPLLGRGGPRVLEWVRELHDRRNCGVVLVGTDVLMGALKNNPVLQQLYRRRAPGSAIKLPAVPPAGDLEAFAAAFILEPAPDRTMRIAVGESTVQMNPFALQSEVVRDEGLGSWVKLLEDAKDSAEEAGKCLTWGRVVITYCAAKAAEQYAGEAK